MGERRLRFSLLLSGLRWRAGSTIALLVVSVVAIGVGAFGPIYLHSADQSILDATLASAPPGADGLTLQPAHGAARPGQLAAAEGEVPRPAGAMAWFGPAIATEEVGITAVAVGQPYASGLVARSGVCLHLHVVTGRCPTAAGQVIMSSRSAQALDVDLGQKLDVTFTGSSRTASLVVAGLYAPDNPNAPFWWGNNYFGFGSGSVAKPELDDVFTSITTIVADAPSGLVSSMLQLPLRGRALPVDAVSSVQSGLARLASAALARHGVLASSQLPGLFSQAGNTEHVSTSVIAVIDLELFLLAVVVLYFVASRTAAERSPDVRLAVLRGFSQRSTMAVALSGPLLVVVAAVPVGLVVAWLVGWASARALFGAGVGASMTLLSLGAAIVGGVVGMATVALGNRRVIADSEIDISPSPSHRRRTLRVMGDTVVVAVAAAAFIELALAGAQGTSASSVDPLSVLAPGLLAAALGVVGARLLPTLLPACYRVTARSASVAWTLATRRVARGSEAAPQVVLLALATGLAVFAVSGWSVQARNRTVQDTFAVGAARVLTVSVLPGVNFLSAVRAADPSGRSAMAAVVEAAPDGTTLAVDASRMSAVMSWPPGLGAGGVRQAARHLVPRDLAPAVEVSGSAIRVTASAVVDAQPAPELSVDLFDNGYLTPEQVDLGPVTPGSAAYQGSLQGLCPSTCRLVDLAVSWAPSSPYQVGTVDLDVTSLSELSEGRWVPVDASLDDASRWTTTPGQARLTPSRSGLVSEISLNPSGAPVALAPNDVASEVPSVVTPTVASLYSSYGPSLSLVGLDGGTVTGRAVGVVPALPRVGSVAALVDLGTVERLLSGPFSGTTTEVWLSARAPSDIDRVLAEQGVTVTGMDSVSARQGASAHGGVQLAYTLFFLAAVAAGVLALAATGFSMAAGARRRRAELADMRSVGFGVPALRRSLQAEQALCVGAGLCVGVVAGLVAAAVALSSVPESVTSSPGPPLELGLPALVLAAAVGSLVLALWLTIWLGSSLLIGATSAGNLDKARR